jgi:fructose-1,6-bisphosphatase/inositol monophosphatase family enzyme
VVAACETQAVEALAAVADDELGGDTIFAVDVIGENVLVEAFSSSSPTRFRSSSSARASGWAARARRRGPPLAVVVVDPIDGTRGLCTRSAAPGSSRASRLTGSTS